MVIMVLISLYILYPKKKLLLSRSDSFWKASYRVRYITSRCVLPHVEIFITDHLPLVVAFAFVDREIDEKEKML